VSMTESKLFVRQFRSEPLSASLLYSYCNYADDISGGIRAWDV